MIHARVLSHKLSTCAAESLSLPDSHEQWLINVNMVRYMYSGYILGMLPLTAGRIKNVLSEPPRATLTRYVIRQDLHAFPLLPLSWVRKTQQMGF